MRTETRVVASFYQRERPKPEAAPAPNHHDEKFAQFDRVFDPICKGFILLAAAYLIFEIIHAVNCGAFERLVAQ